MCCVGVIYGVIYGVVCEYDVLRVVRCVDVVRCGYGVVKCVKICDVKL